MVGNGSDACGGVRRRICGEWLRRAARGRWNAVVAAVANVVVVAEAKCGVRSRSEPDSGALKRTKSRSGDG